MILVVYKDGEKVFEGSPIDEDGAFSKEMPDKVREYLTDAWAYWKNHYRGDFGRFWKDYILRRMPSNMMLGMLGYAVEIEV